MSIDLEGIYKEYTTNRLELRSSERLLEIGQAEEDDKWMCDNFPHVEGKKNSFKVGLTADCPFCSATHSHGDRMGGREADCGRGQYYMIPTGRKVVKAI